MADNGLHIAVIPDGNRRWAKAQGLAAWKGHEHAAQNFQNLVEACRDDPRVNTFTVWLFSTENWKRDAKEVEKLMTMLEKYLRKDIDDLHEKSVRLLHSGRKDRLSPGLSEILEQAIEQTKDCDQLNLHFALDYGGKDEILRATERMSQLTSKRVNESTLRECLDQPNLKDIDLIIRTSGEHRTSNFFFWQSAYAEWIFEEKLFPDFNVDDLNRCLDEYEGRKRRFGS